MFLQQNIINQNMNDWIFQFPFRPHTSIFGKGDPPEVFELWKGGK